MTAKQFLLENKGERINLAGVARIMYGDKDHARILLSKKLNGTGDRVWTSKDEQKAIAALKELHIDIGKVIEG